MSEDGVGAYRSESEAGAEALENRLADRSAISPHRIAKLAQLRGWARKRTRSLIGSTLIAIAALAVFVSADGAIDKLMNIRYRLQLLEIRQASLGRELSASIEAQQAALGPARFNASAAPSPFAKGTWDQVGGEGINRSWSGGHWRKTKAMAVYQDRLYVGLYGPSAGDAQVWRYDGRRWTMIGGASLDREWRQLSDVTALLVSEGRLIAAIDDTVWAYDPAVGWKRISGARGDGSWPRGQYRNAYSLAEYHGRIVVGLSGGPEAAVYEYLRGSWRKIGGDGSNASWSGTRYAGVYELWAHTDGYLYAGMHARVGMTAIFRYDGANWQKVAGDGVNDSWRDPGTTYVLSFASFQGRLIASTNRHPMIEGNFSSIWAFDGRTWRPVGLDHVPSLWGQMHNYNALAVYGDHLVIGAGGHPAGNASVWVLENGIRPTQVGGHGIHGSWGSEAGAHMSPSRDSPSEYIYRFVVWRGDLYAGFGESAGMAQVWRFRPEAE